MTSPVVSRGQCFGVVSAVFVWLFLAGGVVPLAQGAADQTAASNEAAARAAAARVLGEVPLPAGATQVSDDPSASTWLSSPASGAPATPNLVDNHQFWRVPGDPKATFDWIKAHRPAGSTVSVTGTGGQFGKTVMWSVTFAFQPVPGAISQEDLGVAVTAAKNGGTAMRADGQAVWLTPRPAGELVPAGTRAVGVFVDHFDGAAAPVSTVRSARKISRLVALVDSLQLAQPGVHSCPAIGADTLLLDLRFLPALGPTPLARIVEDGCGGLSFSIHRRLQPELAEGPDLTALLWTLGALPVCHAKQLSASATLPTRFPGDDLVAQVNFRNVSSTVCALKGFARMRLADRRGRALPSRITNALFPAHAVILTPRTSAGIGLRWPRPGRSCKAPTVSAITITLPKVHGRFRVSVGSRTRPVAPCRGRIRADAIV